MVFVYVVVFRSEVLPLLAKALKEKALPNALSGVGVCEKSKMSFSRMHKAIKEEKWFVFGLFRLSI